MKNFHKVILAIFVLVSVLPGCNKSKPSTGEHFLWKITSGKATMYLLAALESPPSTIYPLPEIIENAFKKSDILVLSINVDDLREPNMKELFAFTDANSLDNTLKKDTYDTVRSFLVQNGFKEEDIKKIKPYFASVIITQLKEKKHNIDLKHNLRTYFFDKKSNKDVQYLYDIKELVIYHDSIFLKHPDEYLRFTFTAADYKINNQYMYLNAWSSGDRAWFARLIDSYHYDYPFIKEEYKNIKEITNRKAMAKIREYSESDRIYFLVVDAQFVMGENGLLKMLESEGRYKIEQL